MPEQEVTHYYTAAICELAAHTVRRRTGHLGSSPSEHPGDTPGDTLTQGFPLPGQIPCKRCHLCALHMQPKHSILRKAIGQSVSLPREFSHYSVPFRIRPFSPRARALIPTICIPGLPAHGPLHLRATAYSMTTPYRRLNSYCHALGHWSTACLLLSPEPHPQLPG